MNTSLIMEEGINQFFSDTDSDIDSVLFESDSDNDDILFKNSRHSITDFVENTVYTYTDKEFIQHFRINRNLYNELVNTFAQSNIYLSLKSHPAGKENITPEKHLLIFLYFAGHEGSGYRAITNLFNISLSTLFAIINRLSKWLCSIAPRVIKWSNNVDLANTKAHFNYYKNFPNVAGLIDGTHILIDKPANDPDSYINRKGQYTIQMQSIVNEQKKFMNVFIGYPGSVHDARVFKNSSIYYLLQEKCAGGYILGDSAYPLTATCLTPYKDNGHLTPVQQLYNNKHSSARMAVEHTFGIFKQRFRYLYHMKFRRIELIVMFIQACAVLHNLASEEDLPDLSTIDPSPFAGNIEYDAEDLQDTAEGREKRDCIANEIWTKQND